MKNTTYVIEETARRTGIKEALVEKVLRHFNEDFAEFINKKKGYNITIPKVGKFSFRMTAVDQYIDKQRHLKKFWQIRLDLGIRENAPRTIESAELNIKKINENIKATLEIKDDYLKNHIKYDRKGKYILETGKANLDRLEELLDVSSITIKNPAAYSIQKKGMRNVSKQEKGNYFPEQKIDNLLSYLQPVQMRPDSKNSKPDSQLPDK